MGEFSPSPQRQIVFCFPCWQFRRLAQPSIDSVRIWEKSLWCDIGDEITKGEATAQLRAIQRKESDESRKKMRDGFTVL